MTRDLMTVIRMGAMALVAGIVCSLANLGAQWKRDVAGSLSQ